MSQNAWSFLDNITDLNGYTLVIPSVAVGNVGQLASDLLISSLDMRKIGSVYSPAFIPILGYDPYNLKSSMLSSSCELYQCVSKHILVLQIRAPLVYKYAKTFLEETVKKFKERNIKDVIVLTSSHAHEKKHILTSPFRYISNALCIHKNKIKTLNWVEHESFYGERIAGGGFAPLFLKICTANQMPCLIIYKFTSEGDNIPDAYEMIHYVQSILSLFDEKANLSHQLSQPVSWKFLFGRPPPQDIY